MHVSGDVLLMFVTAERVGSLDVNPAADLEQMRGLIQGVIKESQAYSNLTDWWFVDCELFIHSCLYCTLYSAFCAPTWCGITSTLFMFRSTFAQ